MVPGPVGMAASAVSAASYAAAGDKKNAVLMAAGIAASAVGAGAAVKGYQVAKGAKNAGKTIEAARKVKDTSSKISNARISVALHKPHHSWKMPWNTTKKWYKHVELRFYVKGQASSHKRLQIPYGYGCKLKNCR